MLANTANLSVEAVFKAWNNTVSTSHFYTVANITNRNARVKFIRYIMTGTFGPKSKYAMGNPTYFALPLTYKDFYHLEDNFFNSFPHSKVYDKEKLMSTFFGGGNTNTKSASQSEADEDIVQRMIDKVKA